jgi:parvulin-like peptidyl-prolyl isomerase
MKRKIMGLFCLLLTVFSLTACVDSSVKDVAVLKIDGQEIMRSEYMVYLYTTTEGFVTMAGDDVWSMDFDGQTADELVEERTISTIQSVIAAKEYAAVNGISLTEEQKAAAAAAADQFVQTVSAEDLEKMSIDVKKLQPMMEDSYLYTLVHQEIAAECDVDATDMEAYYQENKAQLKKDYTSLKLQTILLDDGEKAAKAAERAKNGEDFLSLFEEYDIDTAAENGGEMTVFQNYLENSFGLTDEMEAGDVAGPLQIGEGWFILKTVEKTVPTDEEVKELAEGEYSMEVQTSYTESRFAEMIKGQAVEKIKDACETLGKFH